MSVNMMHVYVKTEENLSLSPHISLFTEMHLSLPPSLALKFLEILLSLTPPLPILVGAPGTKDS